MTVYEQQYFNEPISAVTLSPSVEPGMRRVVGDEEYIYAYNNGNSQAQPSYGVTLSGVTGYSFTLSSLTNVDMFGIVKHSTIVTAAYGWIMKRGFAQMQMGANNSCAAGDLLCPGADGTFGVATQTTLPFGHVVGKAMSAAASAASGCGWFRFF